MEDGLSADTASGERRSSIVQLQSMLKKVSHSSFHNQHKNRVNGSLAQVNPFYAYYLESGSNGHMNQDAGATSSENTDCILMPSPQFRSSPLDLQPGTKTVENKLFEPQTHDVTLDTPELFRTDPVEAQFLSHTSQLKSLDLYRSDVKELFQATKNKDLLQAEGPEEEDLFGKTLSVRVDPFKPPSNKDDLFQLTNPLVGNPFYTNTTKENLFQAAPTKSENHFVIKEDIPTNEKNIFSGLSKKHLDVFSTSSIDSVDPFQSPVTKTLFQDASSLDDPFGSTPSKREDTLHRDISRGTPDIFQPLPKQNIFEETPSRASSLELNSTSSGPARMKSDLLSTSDLFNKAPARPPPPPVPPKLFQKPPAAILTTPGETEHEIFALSPFSRVRNLSMTPRHSPADMTHVQTFKRPPKPLPRTRAPKPEKPTQLEGPPQPAAPIEPKPKASKSSPKPIFKHLPKPVTLRKPTTPEKKVDPENFVVFEDILLIGQECCVEDWPEDSPQFNPDFRPPGKLKLRRESLKMTVDYEGGAAEDQDESNGKKKEKKFRISLLSRRGSKEKFQEDMEAQSRVLPIASKPSKEYFSDLHVSAEEIEDEGQMEMDYKKKPLKTKVNQLLQRSSTNSHTYGLAPQDMRDVGTNKKSKKNSIRRWSEGTVLEGSTGEDDEGADSQQEKKQKKLKIKFVPRRGFTITSDKTNDEPKGASGFMQRKSSKDDVLNSTVIPKLKSSDSLEDFDFDELNRKEDYKPDSFTEEELTGKYLTSPQEMFDSEQEELDTCKPKKQSKFKGFKKRKSKSKAMDYESEDPPGATSCDYLSEAAKAEWQAAQRDGQTIDGLEEEEDEEQGDTDSLMEWWNTVEQWDEVPSDDEDQTIKEDESKSFSILADKVHRGLRVFNKVFTERAEVLWQSIITLSTIADDISEFHQKARIAGITGGTTTAVGGVTAIAGLALVPFTFGASLVITAVGVGVATAGGIASASAAISDNVNNMHDRKKVEVVLQNYEIHLLDIRKILHFINQGVYKLRGHPFLRSGTQHYSEDWEVRRAVQMISLVDAPVMRAMEITDEALSSLQGLFKGMDKYFIKDSRELKKGCKKEVVAQIREVANILNDAIVEVNFIREELQDATGNM